MKLHVKDIVRVLHAGRVLPSRDPQDWVARWGFVLMTILHLDGNVVMDEVDAPVLANVRPFHVGNLCGFQTFATGGSAQTKGPAYRTVPDGHDLVGLFW